MKCSIDGCEGIVEARSWCKRHYMRWFKAGHPLAPKRHPGKWAPIEERFWAKVNKTDDCWEWTAGKDNDGYGVFSLTPTKQVKAHRLAYTLSKGTIPLGLVSDHLCRNRGCVNPEHLEFVTDSINNHRQWHANSKKTHCPQGHPYDKENTYVLPNGDRQCMECRRAYYWTRDYRSP